MKFSKIKEIGYNAGRLAQEIQYKSCCYEIVAGGVCHVDIDTTKEVENLKKMVESIGLQKPKLYRAFTKAFARGAYDQYNEKHSYLESASLLDLLMLFPKEKWDEIISITQLGDAVVSCGYGWSSIKLQDAVDFMRDSWSRGESVNSWLMGHSDKVLGKRYWDLVLS